MRQAMSAACWTLTILVGWLSVACGQSCLQQVNPHAYCGDSSCPPEDRIVGNPTDYCRTFFQFQNAHIFPDKWELLFDSDDYRQSNVLGSVFLEREFDSDASTLSARDRTWIQQGGECQRQFRACAWRQGQQNNWIFSKHIKYPPGSTTAGGGYSTEVYLNITYRFSSCNSFAGCTNNFVTLYRYDTDSIVLEAERTDKTNYALLFGSGTENTVSRFQQIEEFDDDNVLRSFTTSGSTGFHLGIRDTGTCGYVDRIILYYTPCHEFHEGLVNYPELVRPPEGSPPNVAQACCAPNSHGVTSLNFKAYSDGRCERDVMCECDAGYILNGTGTGCDPCAAGLYRSENDLHDRDCLACPENTIGTEVNATNCSCAENYFRCVPDKEGPEIGCTTSPTHPGPPNCTLITGTSIEIEWNPPSDQGGRTDTFYTVEHQAIGSTGDYIAGISTNNTSYPISNLEPVTQYRIRVVAENCVSEQDMRPGIRATRTSEVVICETGEGKPEAPSSPEVVENIVFLWQPPIKPNGIITGYQIGITYNSSTEGSGKVSPSPEPDAMTFHYVLRKGVIPENVTATITVTAKTSAGLGEPSDPKVFEPFASAVVEKVIERCTLEGMGLSIALSAVIAAAVTAVVFFVILCCAYCICKCKNKGAYDTSKNGYTNKASSAYDMPEKNVNWT